MRVLVLGASGATGKLVVRQLIKRKITTRILVRNSAVLPSEIIGNPFVEILKGNINELNRFEMNNVVKDCSAIILCLGHNISLKGLYGQPRYLVLDAIRSLCETINSSTNDKIKIILMNTTAFTNKMEGEKNTVGERIIFSLLMLFLPPHRDNVKAVTYLINNMSTRDGKIEWIAVRPDTLIENDVESSYEVCKSPKRSPIFNAGKTSRINVSRFMIELITDEVLWTRWLFKTPVIYNK